MFLYYAFWELTLGSVAIIISMFGRDAEPRQQSSSLSIPFCLALLLVGIIWLYAKTGTFDFVRIQSILAQDTGSSARGAVLGLASSSHLAVKVPVFPLHGWLGDVFSGARRLAMVVAGKLGLYLILRFNLGLFPAQARQVAPWMIALAVIRRSTAR